MVESFQAGFLSNRRPFMPQNPPTLTRQTLYDLVWSKPMSNLTGDFGISDVPLKRCRQVDVPILYRGYWAWKAAGQNPPKLALPKAPKQPVRSRPEPEVRFAMPSEPVERDPPSTIADADEQAFQERLSRSAISHVTELRNTCATVRRTAKHAKHSEPPYRSPAGNVPARS
jgi:hypothetical protein